MPKRRSPDELTAKQKLFAAEYLKDRNARAAAIRAGYSETTAKVACNTLVEHPGIAAVIKKNTDKVVKRSEVSAEFVIRELMSVASQEDVAQSTKVRALELLAKHLGMLEDKISLKTDGLSAEQRAERVAVLLERVRTR